MSFSAMPGSSAVTSQALSVSDTSTAGVVDHSISRRKKGSRSNVERRKGVHQKPPSKSSNCRFICNDCLQVGAYLPPLLRGLYYEGWHPTARSLPLEDREVFLERIHEAVSRDPGIDAELVARGVFTLLARRLPASELEDVRAVTPVVLHAFWPV